MPHNELHHVRGDEPPPLPRGERRAVIAQQQSAGLAGEAREQQQHAAAGEDQPEAPVVVERPEQPTHTHHGL